MPEAGLKLTPRHYSYLKISEGCNHRCAFCIIPHLRGDLVSRRPDAILREAEKLVAAGTRELLVISQDTSRLRRRHPPQAAWPWKGGEVRAHMTDLPRELGKLGAWVRLHYVYPYPHVDNVIPLMAEGLVLPYLDIPFQHASPKVLRAMRRPANDAKVLERIRSVARAGAGPRHPLELRRRLSRRDRGGRRLSARLARGSAARPRRRVQVRAGRGRRRQRPWPIRCPRTIKQERYERVMALSARISAEKLARKVGSTIDVLIDAVDAETGGATGRSKADAPEIDGEVHLRDAGGLKPGDIVQVRVEDADEHDLYGVPFDLA